MKTLNGKPVAIKEIPVHKTDQIPCRAMNIKESTADGNIEVVENLLRQGRIGCPTEEQFSAGQDVDTSEYMFLFHGDLLTIERLESAQSTRKIESTPKNRFQFIIPVPGLFHFLMAGADALRRIWLAPPESRIDDSSLYAHVGATRPDETGKMTSKRGYWRTLEVVQHDLTASMLDCWSIVAKEENKTWSSLEEFAKGQPSWDTVVTLSENIVHRFVATTEELSDRRRMDSSQRDAIFENQ